jgi:hypothetical protein
MTGARQRETAARQDAGGAEPDEPTCRLSQRRQRKRRGRVTDAAAHMPRTLSMNRAVCPSVPSEAVPACDHLGWPRLSGPSSRISAPPGW